MIEALFRILVGLALFLFPFSVIFISFGKLPAGLESLSAVVILLYALILLVWKILLEPWDKAVRNFLMILAFGWTVEWIGVSSGFPFGSYQYTLVLGSRLWGVPMAIPFAWYATLMSALGIASATPVGKGNVIETTILAAFLVLALDLVLEPTARVKQYWVWKGGEPPLQNYVSWFLLAFMILLPILLRTHPLKNPKFPRALRYSWTPRLIYGLQWLLFAFTDLLHGYGVAVLGSFLLVGGTVGVSWVSAGRRPP